MTRSRVLDVTADRLHHALAAEQVSARLPSLVAGVVRDGELVWWGARGSTVREGETSEPDYDTQYRVGSITKTMTAVLIMQLRDEGALDLGDRLDRHLPGIGYGDRTIRQVLSHSSGMQSEPAGSWWERSPGVSFEALSSRVSDAAAPLPTGRQYHYSNLGFGLLGEVIARSRRCTWWEALSAQLLQPLGMARTSYLAMQPAADGFSVNAFADTLTSEPAQDTAAMAPAGQVWSTVRDLGIYAAFLADPDPQVLRPETLSEMATVQSGTPQEGLTGAYALGLRMASADGRTFVGHTGSMPGFLAGMFVDRERHTAAVALANATAGLRTEGLPLDLLTTLERHQPSLPAPWTPVADVADDVKELLGLWHWGETALSMSYDGELLRLARLGSEGPAYTFRRLVAGRYVGVAGYHAGETLAVARRADGTISHLECATFVYTRVPYDPEAPIPGGPPEAP